MIEFPTIILQFEEQGEKTGWTYIQIPADVAQNLKPDHKKSFRVKGKLDQYSFSGVALMPMGKGNFIMALNADIRKGIRKSRGAMLIAQIEEDTEYSVQVPYEMIEYFADDPETEDFFMNLTKSHREYFIKWIESAKIESTRVKRIVQTIDALSKKLGYPEMIRKNRGDNKLG